MSIKRGYLSMTKKGYFKDKRKFFRNLEIIRSIQDTINLIEYKLQNEIELKEWHNYSGQLEALKGLYNKPIKDIFEEIKITNEELKSLDDDSELFEMHIQYLKGYKNGCEKILNYHRSYKERNEDIKILVYTQEEALKDILIILFESAGIKYDHTLNEKASACISTNVDMLNHLAESVDSFKFVFTVKPISNRPFTVSSEQAENIKMLKKELSEKIEQVHSREDNLFSDVKLLNQEWLEATYVYINSMISIEQVFLLMISSLRLKE